MAWYDNLLSEAGKEFGLGNKTGSFVRELLGFMTNEREGGITGFIDRFRRAGLSDIVDSWIGTGPNMPINTSQVESALGANFISTLSSKTGLGVATVLPALAGLLPKIINAITPNGMLPTNSGLLSQLSGFLDVPQAARTPLASTGRAVEETKSGMKPLWWALGLGALALLGWMILRPSPGNINPTLTLHNSDGKIVYTGLVRDEGTKRAIVDSLASRFGAGNISGEIRVDSNVKKAPWLGKLTDVFAMLRTPGTELAFNGDAVNVGGWMSAADRQAMLDKLKGYYPNFNVNWMGDRAGDAVRSATEKATAALAALGSGFSADKLVDAMNMSIINFSTGSAQIPSEQMDLIKRSANAIKMAPKSVKIEIAGYTDNEGDPDANQKLSEARANSVKVALVQEGVPENMLIARGYGEEKPIAPNDSEYGRFRNRRIEFGLVQ